MQPHWNHRPSPSEPDTRGQIVLSAHNRSRKPCDWHRAICTALGWAFVAGLAYCALVASGCLDHVR
jgi:hypothetical protein